MLPNSLQFLFLEAPVEEAQLPPAAAVPAAEPAVVTAEYFKILKSGGQRYPQQLENLAVRMAEMKHLRPLLLCLRRHYVSKEYTFAYSMEGLGAVEQQELLALLKALPGAVSDVRISAEQPILWGKLNSLPKAVAFLTGQYYEIAVSTQVRRTLEKLGRQLGQDWEIYDNAMLQSIQGKCRNEFDVLFRFGSHWYGVEAKSGRTDPDYGHYHEIGSLYGIVPRRFLMVNTWVEEEQIPLLEYFTEYYLSNGSDIEEKIEMMIRNDQKECE